MLGRTSIRDKSLQWISFLFISGLLFWLLLIPIREILRFRQIERDGISARATVTDKIVNWYTRKYRCTNPGLNFLGADPCALVLEIPEIEPKQHFQCRVSAGFWSAIENGSQINIKYLANRKDPLLGDVNILLKLNRVLDSKTTETSQSWIIAPDDEAFVSKRMHLLWILISMLVVLFWLWFRPRRKIARQIR